MEAIKQFLGALFAGLDPIRAANWIRGLVGVFWAGLTVGIADVLVQLLGILNDGGALIIDKMQVLRTMLLSILPFLVGFFRSAPKDNQ